MWSFVWYVGFWIFGYGYILLPTQETLFNEQLKLYLEWLSKRFIGRQVIRQPGAPTVIRTRELL